MKNSKTNEFVFENIVLLTDRNLLKLLKQIENSTLLLACHGDGTLIDRVASVFSEYGRRCFHKDLGDMGIVNDEDQAAARKEIEDIFNELYQRGRLRHWAPKCAAKLIIRWKG